MSPATLRGRCIAVTRPEAQSEALAAGIEARGGIALRFPLIIIEAIDDSDEIRAVRATLAEYDIAFFVSPNAVEHGLAVLGGRVGWPAWLRVAGVGQGTRAALERQGFESVIAPETGADSEAVLALPEFSPAALAGRGLLIVRGDGGRDLLGREAARRGARVRHVSCYRRRPPPGDARVLLDAAREGRLAALVVTSSEALDNLGVLAGESGLEVLRSLPVFAPHPRIAERAAALGFETIVTTGAGDSGIMAGLDAHFERVG
ncbi:MAG: uroporphyrinogen-III synthase [Rhodocyclaceae bacterium]|nr:uroporphyrinogen-III synthase [Rhodocyclaceae bacterium]